MNNTNFVLLKFGAKACVASIYRNSFSGKLLGTILSHKRFSVDRYTKSVYNIWSRTLASKINILCVWSHLKKIFLFRSKNFNIFVILLPLKEALTDASYHGLVVNQFYLQILSVQPNMKMNVRNQRILIFTSHITYHFFLLIWTLQIWNFESFVLPF